MSVNRYILEISKDCIIIFLILFKYENNYKNIFWILLFVCFIIYVVISYGKWKLIEMFCNLNVVGLGV